MKDERRQEKRYPCQATCIIYLGTGDDEQIPSPHIQGQLEAIGLHGASITLPAILVGRTHLAYAAHESNTLTMYLSIPLSDEENITIPCRLNWYNLEPDSLPHPFKMGLQFNKSINTEQLAKIRNLGGLKE